MIRSTVVVIHGTAAVILGTAVVILDTAVAIPDRGREGGVRRRVIRILMMVSTLEAFCVCLVLRDVRPSRMHLGVVLPFPLLNLLRE